MSQNLNMTRYLGLPSLIGRNKKTVFSYLKSRLWQRIHGWRHKFLSRAGKGVLIQSVGQALPSYVMSSFLLHTSLADELQRMLMLEYFMAPCFLLHVFLLHVFHVFFSIFHGSMFSSPYFMAPCFLAPCRLELLFKLL